MINRLKVTIFLIYHLIISNPWKIICLLLALISFKLIGTFDKVTNNYGVVGEIKYKGDYIYVTERISSGIVRYENIWSKEAKEIKNGEISDISDSAGNGIMIFLTGSFLLVFVIVTIMAFINVDDEWKYRDCWHKAFSRFITCEIEKDKYYYMAFGRLLSIEERQLSRYNSSADELCISSFTKLYNCPKYKTPKEKREILLTKLGII